jgi:hypothetical protein
MFDLTFVDGHHLFEQAYRDVINAFRHTSRRGLVALDDVVPLDELSALRDRQESRRRRTAAGLSTDWHGDVYVALAILRDYHPELAVRVIVGSGNEQAILWNKEPNRIPTMLSEDAVARYRDLRYMDVFRDGVPNWFNPANEETVLSAAAASVVRR